ncbi:MAG TPA: type I-E CRISPR-associated protein Cas5/CasD [Anaerolineaceae bacterium]|nr:type I-E CRISPR-associated protein Cas5/CasD [Anaerolineaceae bacterium]
MNTLLLRLSGAMQSWGVQSRFSVRDTGLEPSKSGVCGLVCAALGIDRADDPSLANIAALRLGVRVDREGILKVDFHTAKDVLRAGGDIKKTEPSNRYYLADAVFLVGLAGEDLDFLRTIQAALKNPVWPIFLGRKAFVPGEPVYLADGLKPGQELAEALTAYPYLCQRAGPARLRTILEDSQGSVVRLDQPLSFQTRRFAPRSMTQDFVATPPTRLEAS